jgi:hypothetical protein
MNNIKTVRNILLLSGSLIGFAQAGYAQQLQQIQNSFNNYQQKTLQEKIFAHTDKTVYVSGELIWFKVFCVDATSHAPLDVSKVAYVEVLDNTQTPILQAKISLRNGIGNGSFNIPVAVSNGTYKLRAYTNWMKNFGADYFFEKKISIINVFKSPTTTANTPGYDVQFFPEGGTMVTGLPNNIALKTVDHSNKGIAIRGAVIDQHNDTVARFATAKFGMGHFAFTPSAGNTYRAIIKAGESKPVIKELPAINSKGYTMQVSDAGTGIEVKVNSTFADGNLYLFAHTGQVTNVAQSAVMANGVARFTISKDKLNAGVSHITIFNSNRQPVCERLYFKRPVSQLTIAANTNMPQYGIRKKVNIQIAAKDASGKVLPTEMSMAVYKLDSLQQFNQDDIISYLWLSSDLRGNIESPGYYFKNNNAAANEAIDNLMLTQGWRKFNWDNVLQDKPASFTYLPEYQGHIISAKITDLLKAPAADVIAYLGIPGKRVQLYAAKSDTKGKLMFNTKDLFGPNEIVLQTNTETDTLHKLEVLNPFFEQYSNSSLPGLAFIPAMKRSLEELGLGMQVQNLYAGSKLKRFYEPGIDSSAFYGRPYKTYKLDDYTRFTTMEEVLREYIAEVSITNSKKRFHITAVDETKYLSGDAMVMLDGIPIFNINKVFALDPLNIRKLEIVRERYYSGPTVYEGILSYTTYKGDLGGIEMDPHAVVIDYEGMQLQREFYSPVYDTEARFKSRTPDFRSTLYWSPDITANSKVSFFTSDQTGKYIGVVQGININGEAGAQTFTFEVK